jgi:hypothetical protein
VLRETRAAPLPAGTAPGSERTLGR